MVVELLVAHNPKIWLIQGRPRTPRDQGSVENANKLVQRVLKAISEERRQMNLPVNWTELLGQVMSVCNGQTGIRTTDCSSYQAVFGQRIHHHIRCPIDEIRKCTSIHQRLRMSSDERLEQYVRDNDIVDVDVNEAITDLDEEEDVDDPNEEEGADITADTFPGCDDDDDDMISRQVRDDLSAVDNQVNTSLGEEYASRVCNLDSIVDGYAPVDSFVDLADARIDNAGIDMDQLNYDHSDPNHDQGQSEGTILPAALFHAPDVEDDADDGKPPFILTSPVDSSSADDDDSKPPADITSSVVGSHDDDSKKPPADITSSLVASIASPSKPPSSRERSVTNAKRGGHDSFNVETQEYEGDKPITPGVVRVRKRDYHRYPISEAWKVVIADDTYPLSHEKLEVNKFKKLTPTLTCADCCQQAAHSKRIIHVIEDAYNDSIVTNSTMWWDCEFITSFTQLAAHYAHSVMRPDMENLKVSNQILPPVPQVMHLTYPRDPITEDKIINFPKDVETIVAVLHDGGHYAVMELDILKNRCVIYDGLYFRLGKWSDHAVSGLRRTKLIGPEETYTLDNDGMGGLIFTFECSRQWSFTRGEFIKQLDGCNCGPLACSKVLEIFGILSRRDLERAYRLNSIRKCVVDMWKVFVRKCNDDLLVHKRVKKSQVETVASTTMPVLSDVANAEQDPLEVCHCFEDHPDMDVVTLPCCSSLWHRDCILSWREYFPDCPYCGNVFDSVQVITKYAVIDRSQGQFISKSPNITPRTRRLRGGVKRNLQDIEFDKAFGTPEFLRNADLERRTSQEKKRQAQLRQAERMIKTRGKANLEVGLTPGAVLSIKPDYRDVSHPMNIIAIAYKTKPTGGVLAATEYGLLCHSTDKKLFWIAHDNYTILYKVNEDATISPKLARVRNSIIQNTYDENNVAKVSIQEVHKKVTGQTSPPKRGACKCAQGNCKTKRCPCFKNGIKCRSECKCNMNCCNPENGK